MAIYLVLYCYACSLLVFTPKSDYKVFIYQPAGVGRKGVVKHAVERCNNACYKFCTKGVQAATSTAY